MTDTDERYMREALREARAAGAGDEVPIGAVVVCRGRVIARGHNMTERLHDPTAHAEMIALTAATEALGGKYLDDCTLYVTVEPCRTSAAATPSSPPPSSIPAPKSLPACSATNAPPWSKNISKAKDKFTIFAPGIEVWCNGSTTDFGSVCSGSNPDTSTKNSWRKASYFC